MNENVLADITIDGQKTPVMMKADRNGFFFVVNRETGKLISAKPFVPVNWATGYDVANQRPIEDPPNVPARTPRSPISAQAGWAARTGNRCRLTRRPA